MSGIDLTKTKNKILFLDEIQATPAAIAALRYFYEELHELKVIGAGSLLEFALDDFHYSMPVGRITYHDVFPLTFEEYLHARNESLLLDHLQSYKLGTSINSTIHEKFCQNLREYFVVGGMPEVVSQFSQEENFSDFIKLQQDI